MKPRKNKRENFSVTRIPFFRWKIGPVTFLIFFIVMIVALVAVSQVLYSYYVQLFNEGVITDVEVLSLSAVTLAAVIGITILVGLRYILHLKKTSRKPIGIFQAMKI